jgi:hypothetical protein
MGDLPDYTRQVTIRYEGGFLGLEELATRLGFIGPWDFKGNIVLMEDFEGELTEWTDTSDGSGSSVARSSRRKHSGDWSAKFSTAAGALRSAGLLRYFTFPGLSKMAIFCRFVYDTDCDEFNSSLVLDDGSQRLIGRVGFDYPTTTLIVETTGASEQVVDAAVNPILESTLWREMLLTLDFANGVYDKLYFLGKEYDLSAIPLNSPATAGYSYGYGYVYTHGVNCNAFDIYVDDIIIAKNVP